MSLTRTLKIRRSCGCRRKYILIEREADDAIIRLKKTPCDDCERRKYRYPEIDLGGLAKAPKREYAGMNSFIQGEGLFDISRNDYPELRFVNFLLDNIDKAYMMHFSPEEELEPDDGCDSLDIDDDDIQDLLEGAE